MLPNIAKTDEEIMGCFDVMHELRPQLERSEFLFRIRQMMNDGYRLMYLSDEEGVITVGSYRIFDTLYDGRVFYVEDLVTADRARSQGWGKRMINGIKEMADKSECLTVALNSGKHRVDAHRFYHSHDFDDFGYHFIHRLK